MAGGASTPALVASVAACGGMGLLAAGYKTPDLLAEEIREVRNRSGHPFGVNVFVPQAPPGDPAGVERFRRELAPEAAAAGVDLPSIRIADDDRFGEKIALLCELRVAVVSFTFGLPSAEIVAALHLVGSSVIATVTSVVEARRADALGVDALCVQGPEAGGHRGTFATEDEPGTVPLRELVRAIHAESDLPLVAAGGIHSGEQMAALLAAGATAVQLGTAFLRTDESGANQTHREALVAARFDRTVITRAFSGRAARGLRNAFIVEHGAGAPRAYPQVHHLTAPLRAAAARRGDPDGLALWAGTGFRAAKSGPAAGVVSRFWAECRERVGPTPSTSKLGPCAAD